MNKPQQLTFPWSKQNKFTFDDFFFDSPNEEVKLALKNNEDVFLYGAEDSGKSFLLQSTCNYYASDYKSSVYIPISEAIKHETGFNIIKVCSYFINPKIRFFMNSKT